MCVSLFLDMDPVSLIPFQPQSSIKICFYINFSLISFIHIKCELNIILKPNHILEFIFLNNRAK